MVGLVPFLRSLLSRWALCAWRLIGIGLLVWKVTALGHDVSSFIRQNPTLLAFHYLAVSLEAR